MNFKRSNFLLVVFTASTLISCQGDLSWRNPTGKGWNQDDAERMFDVLNGYIPYSGDGMIRYDFDDETGHIFRLNGLYFVQDAITVSFDINEGLSWLDKYEKSLTKTNFELFSDHNGAPKKFYNIYHNYYYGKYMIELELQYERDDDDLESVKLIATKNEFGRISDGKKDASMSALAEQTGDLPFYRDGIYLFYAHPTPKYRDSTYINDDYYIRWYSPKSKDYEMMDLLEDGGYEELNPDSERSVAFYHVATDHTTNITYKQADSDIMQSDGKNEYCLYSFFVELFFGFPASDYEHLVGYVVPGLADVQAQVKCAGSRSETALYYVFLSINVSSLNQVLINDSWTVTVFSENSNSLNFHAYKNISGKNYAFSIYYQEEIPIGQLFFQ